MKTDKELIYEAMIHLMTRLNPTIEGSMRDAVAVFKAVYGREPIGIGQED